MAFFKAPKSQKENVYSCSKYYIILNILLNAMQISSILLKLKEYDDDLGKIDTNEGNISSNSGLISRNTSNIASNFKKNK